GVHRVCGPDGNGVDLRLSACGAVSIAGGRAEVEPPPQPGSVVASMASVAAEKMGRSVRRRGGGRMAKRRSASTAAGAACEVGLAGRSSEVLCASPWRRDVAREPAGPPQAVPAPIVMVAVEGPLMERD